MLLVLLVCAIVILTTGAEAKHQHHHHNQDADKLRRQKLAEQARDTFDTHDYLHTSRGTWQTLGVSVVMITIVGLLALFVLLCCLEPMCGACRKLWWIVSTVLGGIFYIPRWLINKLCCCGRLSGPGASNTAAAVVTKKKWRPADLETLACQNKGCRKRRMLINNCAKRAVLIAQCEEHTNTSHGGRALTLGSLERPDSRYQCNFHYLDEPFSGPGRQEAQRRLEETIVWAEHQLAKPPSPERKKGFIYVFSSKDDGRRPDEPEKHWFYKIGETTQAHAIDRVNEWNKEEDNSLVFDDSEGVGWWPTNNAPVAEALVHAMFGIKRYVRFNARRDKDEIEWFFASRKEIQETIARVVKRVDAGDFSALKIVQ